jgi:hypothetical protein
MSGHLSSAEAGLDVFSTPASAAHEAAIAAARTAATSGDVSLSSLSEYYGDKLLPGPSVCKGMPTFPVFKFLCCVRRGSYYCVK